MQLDMNLFVIVFDTGILCIGTHPKLSAERSNVRVGLPGESNRLVPCFDNCP
jgi:hypothetical protein